MVLMRGHNIFVHLFRNKKNYLWLILNTPSYLQINNIVLHSLLTKSFPFLCSTKPVTQETFFLFHQHCTCKIMPLLYRVKWKIVPYTQGKLLIPKILFFVFFPFLFAFDFQSYAYFSKKKKMNRKFVPKNLEKLQSLDARNWHSVNCSIPRLC